MPYSSGKLILAKDLILTRLKEHATHTKNEHLEKSSIMELSGSTKQTPNKFRKIISVKAISDYYSFKSSGDC